MTSTTAARANKESNMTSCSGKRKKGGSCNKILYRCKKCNNVGCDHVGTGECSNQAFNHGKCVKCGASGQSEMF
jgi:hypothetical protein